METEVAGIDLEEEVIDAIVALGYKRAATLFNAFVADGALEGWLQRLKNKIASAADLPNDAWLSSPVCAAQPGPGSASSSAGPRDANHIVLVAVWGPCQTRCRRTRAIDSSVRKALPWSCAHSRDDASTPIPQRIQRQCQQKAWSWVPWRRVLSEAALLDMQSRKASAKKRDFAEVVAKVAGLCCEEKDAEISGSPRRIFQLLCTRAHAYVLCGGGRLHAWMCFVNRFIVHYSRRPGNGWRGPTPQEAEEADREIFAEVFRQVHRDGLSVDDALSSVVREDFFRHYLGPRPRLGSEPEVPKKRKLPAPVKDGGAKALVQAFKKGKAGECFDWAEGKCQRAVCKFPHASAICKDPGHSSKKCPKLS